ncbi:MAG: hypothetical protein ACK2TU_03020 [Anaerolineales bacterium]
MKTPLLWLDNISQKSSFIDITDEDTIMVTNLLNNRTRNCLDF